jgi:hypothetical protein
MNDAFREEHVTTGFKVYFAPGASKRLKFMEFLRENFPVSFKHHAETGGSADLPKDITEFSYDLMPIVVIPNWSKETQAFAKKALRCLYPANVIAMVTSDKVNPLDLVSAGFKPTEVVYPYALPERAVEAIKHYDMPYIPLARVGQHHAMVETTATREAANDDKRDQEYKITRVRPASIFNGGARMSGAGQTFTVRGLTVDTLLGRAYMSANPHKFVSISDKESLLLELLYNNLDRAVKKHHIMQALYGSNPANRPQVKTLDVFKCKIAKKLGSLEPAYEFLIQPCWGNGYVMSARNIGKAYRIGDILGRSRPGVHFHAMRSPGAEIPPIARMSIVS